LQYLSDYDLIFKSAGVPYVPEVLAVQDNIITQVQFFFNHYQGKVIAITASKGKTTMASLAYALLKNAGYKVKVVGNIGKPVLDEIDFSTEYDFVIIELSSYMLQTLKKQNFLSILGAIFPEHLDWHEGFEKYVQAKLRILEGSERNIVLQTTPSQYCGDPLFKGFNFPPNTIYTGKGTNYYRDTDFFYC
jgi:UDP-N-acetylmuramoylalanine--D-glutamate ligase